MARRALPSASLAVVQALDALPASAWLIACSGGADSLALAWAATHVSRRRGSGCRAVVIDHGLQEGSDAVAVGVVATLAGFGLAAEVVRVKVEQSGAGLEADARAARYSALGDARRPSETILLGHTLDDQAETVLLGLARGSGVRSLAGMASSRGDFRRPLLGLGRETTLACCAEQGLEHWQDPHNEDEGFARVRVRKKVIPMLESELGPGIREALARTASLARADADLLDSFVEPAPQADPAAAWLAGLDPALRGRVLRQWLLTKRDDEVTATHVAAIERLVTHWHGQKGVAVPGGLVIRRDGRLRWRPHSG